VQTSSANESPPLFDRVLIREGGAWKQISLDEFFALPLSLRIRHVIERTVAFQLNGTEVDQREALAALRRARVQS
jgi:hypothetical protein